MKIKKIIAVLLSLVITAASLPVCIFAQEDDSLSFGSDGKFTILQISDSQDDQYPAHELVGFIKLALETTNPDLVVFTGDIVEDSRFGDVSSDDNKFHEGVCVEDKNGNLDYEATLANVNVAADAIFAPIEEAGIPFAITQGNNDYNSGISNKDWLEIYASYPHCITVDQSDDEEGKIDSYIEINKYNSSDTGFGLWMLDNGRSFTEGQAEWFSSYQTGSEPSIVFEHIPVDDVGNLFEKCNLWDSGALAVGLDCYRINQSIANGVYYHPYAPGKTTEQFTSWKSKNVIGAFFGHIHTDGYTGEWDGITLGLTYGCEFAKAGPYGFRTVTLDENGTFETELHTYSNGTASVQVDKTYPTYESKIVEIFNNFFRIFANLYDSVAALLKF